jgi:phenylpropionate dioxygenase-like ring-hydroxylating dioxygenase large terminal subunit
MAMDTTAAERARTDSEDLTRVGPGTVMGDFMRQYWVPALKSSELQRDGDPVRLMLLGEKLLAFRDTAGRVGVMQHQCPHRCASLFLGRNEEGGIRCIYHGWKFDVEGRCIDMPNVPPAQDFKDKVRAKAYPTAERNGIVWAYLGPRKQPPPLPMIEATLLPEDQVDIIFMQRRCNWLQALEGDIDTSHFGFLHAGHLDPDDVPDGHPLEHTASERAPQYHVRDVPWGTSYGAFRAVQKDGQARTYWRFANFMFPFWTQTPQGNFPIHVHARAWVPLDDEHMMFVFVRWRSGMKNTTEPLKHGKPLGGTRPAAEFATPVATGWHDRFKLKAVESNDWLIDREAQRSGRIYSGIDNIHLQDQAVTESMGPITDHAHEHLGPGDLMIARTRRRVLLAARALRDSGTPAPGVDAPEVFLGSRSGFFLADPGADWQRLYDEQVDACARPAMPKVQETRDAVPAK